MKIDRENLTNRIIMALVGILIIGLAVGGIRYANLGLDPFTSSITGLSNIFGLGFAKIYPIVNGIIIVFLFFADRGLLGLVTFLNMLFIGPLADFTYFGLLNLIENPSLVTRWLIFALSLVVVSLGVSLCNNSDLGTGPYDTLQLLMTDKIRSMNFMKSRVICDVTCLLIALIGRVKLGAGTVITALMTGPIVGFFDKNVSGKINSRKVYN